MSPSLSPPHGQAQPERDRNRQRRETPTHTQPTGVCLPEMRLQLPQVPRAHRSAWFPGSSLLWRGNWLVLEAALREKAESIRSRLNLISVMRCVMNWGVGRGKGSGHTREPRRGGETCPGSLPTLPRHLQSPHCRPYTGSGWSWQLSTPGSGDVKGPPWPPRPQPRPLVRSAKTHPKACPPQAA